MNEKKKTEDQKTSSPPLSGAIPRGPGWRAFSCLFGTRAKDRESIHVGDENGRRPSCELFVLPDLGRLAVTASPVFAVEKGGGESFRMEIMFAVKDLDNWQKWTPSAGWEFKGNFFASPGEMEELVALGKGCGPALAWRALVGSGDNQILVRNLLDRVFGHAAIDECLLLESTANPAGRKPRQTGPSV